MKHHLMKLQAIAHSKVQIRKKTESIVSEAKKEIQNFKFERNKAHKFQLSERNSAINKENQILLSKLVEISTGRFISVPISPSAASHTRNSSLG